MSGRTSRATTRRVPLLCQQCTSSEHARPRTAHRAVAHTPCAPGRVTHVRSAITLIELTVTVGVIALLVSILLPSLSAARDAARQTACRSNLHQIAITNTYYADDNDGAFVPGAANFRANLDRWHGRRDRTNRPFDPARGPLQPYFGGDGGIRDCPSFDAVAIAEQSGGFERGSGGYGYNNAYLGVRLTGMGDGVYVVADDRTGVRMHLIRRPAETLMFADTAFARDRLIEYGFAEPRFHLQYPDARMDPSIHFRHGDQANVAWSDAHVGPRYRTFTWTSGLYRGDPDRLGLGWFGDRDDNSAFDLD